MSQIFEPNYTQIPNIIFDYWMERLTPAEFKVLLCICRNTLGLNKKRNSISLKQMMTMTGLSREYIIEKINALIQIGIINKIKSKRKDGGTAPNQYNFSRSLGVKDATQRRVDNDHN